MFLTSTAVPSTFDAFMAANNITADHPNLDGWRRVWQNELQVEATVPAVTPACPAWCTLDDPCPLLRAEPVRHTDHYA
jgi:hypothetical protein